MLANLKAGPENIRSILDDIFESGSYGCKLSMKETNYSVRGKASGGRFVCLFILQNC